METNEFNTEIEHHLLKARKSHQRGKIAGGILIILFGVLFLLKRMHYPIPAYLLGWQSILIGLGLVILIKHKFRKFHGYILILIGKLSLIGHWYPHLFNKELIFPIVIILFGLMFLFSSKRKHKRKKFCRDEWKRMHRTNIDPSRFSNISEDDFIDSVSFFGGIKKNVVSKQFKGGDIVAIFGGTEINMNQADFDGRIVFDITNVFGGTSLTVPGNWQVISEVVSIFGGFDDKRPEQHDQNDSEQKTLVLRGTNLFGGIEVNSYNS